MANRIQRKRTKGWKMPENTVSVTRPGKWGNPFKIGEYVKIGNGKRQGEFSFLKAVEAMDADHSFTYIDSVETCVEVYRLYITNYPPKDLHELKGKNLACFCKEGEPCHADILIELANR